MKVRHVQIDDLWSIMRLYQIHGSTMMQDDLFVDYERLKSALLNPQSHWVLSEVNDKIACVFALLIDRELGLSKLSRIMIDPRVDHVEAFVTECLEALLTHLKQEIPELDLVYTTTFTLPMAFQKITLRHSFKVLGVFPNAHGVDEFNLNGLSVAYLHPHSLVNRDLKLRLHETTLPFFELARKALDLPEVTAQERAPSTSHLDGSFCELPVLELIHATAFVRNRFEALKASRSQIVNFYPFYMPNCVISDPAGKVEIFLRVIEKTRFAAIIGEHIRIPVNPKQMFNSLFSILRQRGINYVELIHDAGDYDGSSTIIESGFTPCGYIPAFKKQGSRRRDYIIYGKAFEFFCRPNLDLIPREYLEFYKQYLKQEQRNYFKGFEFDISDIIGKAIDDSDVSVPTKSGSK